MSGHFEPLAALVHKGGRMSATRGRSPPGLPWDFLLALSVPASLPVGFHAPLSRHRARRPYPVSFVVGHEEEGHHHVGAFQEVPRVPLWERLLERGGGWAELHWGEGTTWLRAPPLRPGAPRPGVPVLSQRRSLRLLAMPASAPVLPTFPDKLPVTCCCLLPPCKQCQV